MAFNPAYELLLLGALALHTLLNNVLVAAAIVPPSTKSWANSSTVSTAAISSTAIPCSYDCFVAIASVDWLWYPTVFTQVVATEVVIISTSGGLQATTTSVSKVNSTPVENLSISQPPGLQFRDFVNQTTVELDGGLILTWPTATQVGYCDEVRQTYLTTIDGKPSCVSLDISSPSPPYTIAATGSLDYPGPIPPSYLSSWGVLTLSECSFGLNGIASENIAVLSLTETTTLTLQASSTRTGPQAASVDQTSTSVSPPQGVTSMPTPTMTSRLTQPAVVATSVPVPSTQAVGSPSPDNAVPSAPGLGAAHLPSPGSESLPGANPSESVSEESSIKDPSSFVAYSNGGFNRASDIPTTAEVITHPDAGLGGVADSHTTQQKGNPTWPTFPVLQPTTVAGVAVKEDSKSQYFIGSQTQTAGAPGITINGTLVSLVPSATALVIGTSTALLAVAPTQDVITLNGLSFTRGPGSNLVIGTYIVRPGALAITVSGRPVSLAIDATALVVGSSTTSLAISPMQAILTANGLTFTRGHGSGLVVGTQTITPGASAVMISGRPVSLAIDATALVVDSSTTSLGISPMQDVLTVNGLTFARGPGSVLAFGTQTIIPGAPAVTISGLSVSLAPSGTATVVSGSTNLALNTKTTPAVLQVEGKSFTVGPGSDLVIGSQTLIPGASAIAIDGTPISLAVGGTALVLGDSTVSVPGSSSTTPVVLDINGASLTEVSGSNFVYGSQTLIPGGSEITLSGTPVSLGTGALDLLLGTQRETLTTSQGLGGIILAGLGSGGPGVPQATSVELHQQVMRKRQATF